MANRVLNYIDKKTSPVVEQAIVNNSPNLSDAVSSNVLKITGRPYGFNKITARNVYGNRWRVDIWSEMKPNQIMVSHSYFVITGDNGIVIDSSPTIEKVS